MKGHHDITECKTFTVNALSVEEVEHFVVMVNGVLSHRNCFGKGKLP